MPYDNLFVNHIIIFALLIPCAKYCAKIYSKYIYSKGRRQNSTDVVINLPLKLVQVITEKSVTSDTVIVVNHHRWAVKSWRQFVTITHQFQRPSLVNFDAPPLIC